MKLKIGLIIGIVLCALVLIGAGVFFLLNNVLDVFQAAPGPDLSNPAGPAVTSTTGVTQSAPAAPTASSTVPLPAAAASPVSTATTTLPPPIVPEPTADLQFEILSVEGSGFSRTVTGQLTNTGTVDLHNPKLKIEMFSNGKLIKNNSQEYVEKTFATIVAGDSVTDKVAIKIGLIDGVNVTQNGVTFVLSFSADELTRQFSYDYQP